MESIDWVQICFRWLHIGGVVILVGGTFFLFAMLAPAAKGLSPEEHNSLRERLLNRWKWVVHIGITVILLSGLAALIKFAPQATSLWHMLMGIKFLFAMVVFFIASALVGRSKGLEPIRQQRRFWLPFNLVVAAMIIMIAGVLRFLPSKPPASDARPARAVVEPSASPAVELSASPAVEPTSKTPAGPAAPPSH